MIRACFRLPPRAGWPRMRAPERTLRAARKALPGAATLCAVLIAGSMVSARPVHAHHSFGAFDITDERTIRGTVVEFEWKSPHTWTRIDVTNADGSVTRWSLEGMSPTFLGRRGWSRTTLAPGDEVEIAFYPLKSGEPGGTLLRVTLPDGTVRVMFNRGQ